MLMLPVTRPIRSNVPAICAEKPIRTSAPTIASSTRDMIMTGILMFRMLFATNPRIAPITAASTTATMGAMIPNLVANSMAITPEPNAIIPAEGTPVPIP